MKGSAVRLAVRAADLTGGYTVLRELGPAALGKLRTLREHDLIVVHTGRTPSGPCGTSHCRGRNAILASVMVTQPLFPRPHHRPGPPRQRYAEAGSGRLWR
jgi:hypothetical protein